MSNDIISAHDLILFGEALKCMESFTASVIDHATETGDEDNILEHAEQVQSDCRNLFVKLVKIMTNNIDEYGNNPKGFFLVPVVDVDIEEVFSDGTKQ